jgi:hypothetical protein
MNQLYGARKSSGDLKDYKLKVAGASNLPEKFSLPYPTIIKNQKVSDCVANSIAYVAWNYNKIQTGIDKEFSTGFIYGYRPDGYYQGLGMEPREALQTYQQLGNVFKETFDHSDEEIPTIISSVNANIDALKIAADPNKCTAYFKLDTIDAIKEALYTYKSYVTMEIYWYDENQLDYSDITPTNYYANLIKGTTPRALHEITIYGWDDTATNGMNSDAGALNMVNSWGSEWGNTGGARIFYTYGFEEAWGITDYNNITIKQDNTNTNKNTNTDDKKNSTIEIPEVNKFLNEIYKFFSKIWTYFYNLKFKKK